MALIRRIGLELEGGWNTAPPTRIHPDGSVCGLDYYYIGEVSSPPLKRHGIEQWLRANYPDGSNNSCGLHVHTSLCNTGRYAQLMDANFYDYWHAELTRWGRSYPVKSDAFWNRLNHGNDYCERDFRPDSQVFLTGKGSARYAQLNYCYNLHGTLEARVLPMFKEPTTALAAIHKHLDIIETWLRGRPVRRYVGAETIELEVGAHWEDAVAVTVDTTPSHESDYMHETAEVFHTESTVTTRNANTLENGADYVSYNVR